MGSSVARVVALRSSSSGSGVSGGRRIALLKGGFLLGGGGFDARFFATSLGFVVYI
jgi:hypothetical protein